MSKKERRSVPVLRFKGFTDDWEQRKWKDILLVNSGKDYKHLSRGSIPVYGTGGYMLSVDKELSNVDAIGIGRKGTIDHPQYLKAPFWTVDTLFFMTPKNDINIDFAFGLSQTINWKKYDESTGLPSLSKKSIDNISIKLPNYNEQIKIGRIISQIDNVISLQQRKLNELKEVKKTLLSQLFPSKGQYRPIIRFKKFTNKWIKRKLGNIAKIIGGGTPSTSNHDYWNGNINWYSPTEIGNNIFVNSSNKKISIKGLNNSSAKLLPGGKTILFTSRAGIGNMAIMLTDGCTNQGFQSWVIDDTKIDIYFLYSLGRLLKHDAIRQASGSTFLEISNKEVKKLLLEIPSFTEQKLIGNMLRKIDDDIVRQKERIILITKIKKNLLQKLFV